MSTANTLPKYKRFVWRNRDKQHLVLVTEEDQRREPREGWEGFIRWIDTEWQEVPPAPIRATGIDKLADDGNYTLACNRETGLYTAGCRTRLTLEQALAHWGPPRKDPRAKMFYAALQEDAAQLKAQNHHSLPQRPTVPTPPKHPRFVVQVQPTATTHGFNHSRVSDISEADVWSIYTGEPGNFHWLADFALPQKDVALHFAADLAVRLGYGMDRSAVDVVEANEERDLSHEEGWGMFEVDGRWMLQRDDEAGKFVDDVDALMWVAQQAREGSARHLVALRKIGGLA